MENIQKIYFVVFLMISSLLLIGCSKHSELAKDSKQETIKYENINKQDLKIKNVKKATSNIVQEEEQSIEQRIPKCNREFGIFLEEFVDCSQEYIAIDDAEYCYEERLENLCGICRVNDSNGKFNKTIPKTDLSKCEPFFLLNNDIEDDIYYFLDIDISSISPDELAIICNKRNIPIGYAQKCYYLEVEKLCKSNKSFEFFTQKSSHHLTQKELQRCAPYFLKTLIEDSKQTSYDDGYAEGTEGIDEFCDDCYDDGYAEGVDENCFEY